MKSKILILAIVLAFTAQAKAVMITLGANNYDVVLAPASYPSLFLQNQPWWQNQSLAFSAASQVGHQLGDPNNGLGPIFAISPTIGAIQWGGLGVFIVNYPADFRVAIVDQPHSVPDTSATLAMLGASFLGLAALRRRFVC